MQINDAVQKGLSANGFASLSEWLVTFNEAKPAHINDLWRVALLVLTGLPADKYQYNDYLTSYLASLGYQGALEDSLFNFWGDIASGLWPLPTP